MGIEFSSKIESPLGPVPSGWKLLRLKDAARKVGSGATPKGGESVYLAARHRVALIRSQNVFDRRFSTEGLAFISDRHAEELSGATVQAGDVLLNITGDGVTFGRSCLVPDFVLPACVNQHVSIIRLDTEKCCPGYLLSYLTHPIVKDYIESFNAGGSRRAVTKGHIESFEIPLPPMSVQESIAKLLGGFDTKIECNRCMNRTLEAMAQAIFQSWFVDFDPVRAKMDGRAPVGMDAATAALFPDHFEDSELGKIPAGWQVGTIGDLADIHRCSINPGDSPNEIFDHYSIPAYDEGQMPKAEAGAAIKSNKYVVLADALLVSKLNPKIRRVWLPSPGSSRAVCSTEFIVFIAKSEVSREYLFVLFHLDEIGGELAQRATGTSNSHQRVQPDDMLHVSCVIPEKKCIRAFTECVRPLFQRITANRNESRTLTALRDTLLPKLISGELRVPEAESLVGKST